MPFNRIQMANAQQEPVSGKIANFQNIRKAWKSQEEIHILEYKIALRL